MVTVTHKDARNPEIPVYGVPEFDDAPCDLDRAGSIIYRVLSDQGLTESDIRYLSGLKGLGPISKIITSKDGVSIVSRRSLSFEETDGIKNYLPNADSSCVDIEAVNRDVITRDLAEKLS